MSAQNDILEDARKRAQSRASILNGLSASFQTSKKSTAAPTSVNASSFSQEKRQENESKLKKVDGTSSAGQTSSSDPMKNIQRDLQGAKDVNSKSVELVMSYLQHMGTDPSQAKSKKSASSARSASGDSTVLASADVCKGLDEHLLSNKEGFTSIRQRNRLHDYLQEQLPSKALLLDNGSVQLDAMNRNKGRKRTKTFQTISNRELSTMHNVTNTRKRRKLWQSALKNSNLTNFVSTLHDQWLVYVYRAFYSKGTDDQTLQARFYNGLELIGALVQIFHSVSYPSSKYQSRGRGPRTGSAALSWTSGTMGYVVEVTSSCYYILVHGNRQAEAQGNDKSYSSFEGNDSVFCIHKVSCNLAILLPNATLAREAQTRITAKQQQFSSLQSESDSNDHDIDSKEDVDVDSKELSSDDLPVERFISNAESTPAGTIVEIHHQPQPLMDSINPKRPVLVVFGEYFESDPKIRRKKFPFIPPINGSAL